MSLFAPYRPDAHGQPLPGLEIEFAQLRDVAGLARISAAREGTAVEVAAERFESELRVESDQCRLWAASSSSTPGAGAASGAR